MRKIKFIALLLALLLLFTSCDGIDVLFEGIETGRGGLLENFEMFWSSADGAENETVSEITRRPKPEETEKEEYSEKPEENTNTENVTEPPIPESDTDVGTVETETGENPESYRESISRSREEVEEMFTLTDEDFARTESLLNNFREIGKVSADYDEVDAAYLDFEDNFYFVQTQVSVANIIYYLDMKDTEASERYMSAYEKFGDIYNLYIDACKEIYNNSPIRDEIFADWTQAEIDEMLAYDPETQELREKNEALQIELNELSDSEFTDRSAEIYAQIVTNNNRIAYLSGYDNYYDYATKEIYGRDYTRADVEAYAAFIQEYYLSNYNTVNDTWMFMYQSLSLKEANIVLNYLYEPFDKLDKNYLQGYVDSFDGSMGEGLGHMFANRNVIFTNSANSHPSAFQTYLNSFETPFCLFGSDGQSTDTIVHEMGHYYAALYNPDVSNYDLAETQSQGNEMLLLNYLSGNMPSGAYATVRAYTLYLYMVETLVCVIVDEFEREVYSLESVEGYTSEDFDAIMDKVCEKYGGKDFIENNITDIDYYWRMVATNNPVYYISYAVSMTASLNILAVADEDTEAGREVYRKLIEEVDGDTTFLAAMELAGLSSPFERETHEKIIDIMTK